MRAKVGYCREGEPRQEPQNGRAETRVRFAEKVMHVCAHKTMKFEDW